MEVFVRVLLALPMIVFGLNKFLMFANTPPPAGAEAQAFLGAMFASYLAKVVGATEIIGGLLLFSKKTTFLGLLILAPVTFNIVAFHFAHDFIGNGIWLFTTALFLAVCFFQKQNFQSLLKTY